MPRENMIHWYDGDKFDNEDGFRFTAWSKSVDSGSDPVCPVAERAANNLLSLAATAKEHAKSNAEGADQEEVKLSNQSSDGYPSSCCIAHQVSPPPHFVADVGQLPLASAGMSPRWGVVSHQSRLHGFVPQGTTHRMYPGSLEGPGASGSPIIMREQPSRYFRCGPGNGGIPLWPAFRSQPYHLQPVHGDSQSPLAPTFRVPAATPYMIPPCSSNDDDSVNSVRPAQRRALMGYPTKTILKKPRVETPRIGSSYHSEASASSRKEEATRQVSSASTHQALSKTLSISTRTYGGVPSIDNEENEAKTSIDSVIEEKLSFSSDEEAVKSQRMISPASSNDYQKGDCEDEFAFGREGCLSPSQRRRCLNLESAASPFCRHYHNIMSSTYYVGYIHPPVQRIHCGPHSPGGPYIPTAPSYLHHGMRPFAPDSMHARMFPPRNISSRGRPGLAAMSHFCARPRIEASPVLSLKSPEQQRPKDLQEKPLKPPALPSSIVSAIPPRQSELTTPVRAMDCLADASGNLNRCAPLTSLVPLKYWRDVDITKDVILPDFHCLVNFPDLLIKSRGAGCDSRSESVTPNTLSRRRCCVMCGNLRVSASCVRSKKAIEGEPGVSSGNAFSVSNNGSSHIIPRQNKGVCTACDVTVWVALELDGLEIKWCKGCKNFRPWSHFGNKSLATKCLRCRDRQKEKYAIQKGTKICHGGARSRK